MSRINLPSVPRSADRDTTVFLQSVKKTIEDLSSGSNGSEISTPAKDYIKKLSKAVEDTLLGKIEESTSLDTILDLIQGSITESQLSKDLGTRIELILTNETAISQETQTRIAEMLATNERVSTETTQRQEADNELTGRVDIILANTDDNRASIVQEVQARTNVTDAHASRLNALDTKTDTSNARIGTLETASSTNTEAIATAKTELRAEFSEGDRLNRAAINSESTSRSNADNALSQRVDTVQATSGDNTASIQQQSTAIAGINTKLNATWSVKADVNGVVGGIALGNNGVTVDFIVRASTFAVQGPSGSKSVPFTVYPDGTVINGETIPGGAYLTDAYIRRAAIDTLQIRKQAVTITSSIYEKSIPLIGGACTTQSVYLDAQGSMVNMRLTLFSFENSGWIRVDFIQNGVSVGFYGFYKDAGITEVFEFSRPGGYGMSSYKVVLSGYDGGYIKPVVSWGATLTVQCLKR